MEWMLLVVFLGAQNIPVTIPMESEELCMAAAQKVSAAYVQRMRATGASLQMAQTSIFATCLEAEE